MITAKLYQELNKYEDLKFLSKINDPLSLVDWKNALQEKEVEIENLKNELNIEETIQELLESEEYKNMKGAIK